VLFRSSAAVHSVHAQVIQMLSVGIVGLPNVGKSSLFNALTAAGAPSENYPFCTVEPNVGTVLVPDPRLDRIHEISASKSKVPTIIQFVDIAGLVKGASEGEGLGNQFLANIREVDAIAHVLRCFDDPDITHVLGDVDPVRDREVVETELILADLDTVERRLDRVSKKAKGGDRDSVAEAALLTRLQDALSRGFAGRTVELSDAEKPLARSFHLLTTKPVLYVANVSEEDMVAGGNAWVDAVRQALVEEGSGAGLVIVCSSIEAELALLEPSERIEFLSDLGLEEAGLDRLIRAAYDLLGLITYFTSGEKESRAWTIPRGARAPEAAGVIHTDFERGFIRAETVGLEDFLRVGSMKAAKEQGLVRSEGKEYVVRDGDILLFRFNV
jgi:ribosome-binding ATPase